MGTPPLRTPGAGTPGALSSRWQRTLGVVLGLLFIPAGVPVSVALLSRLPILNAGTPFMEQWNEVLAIGCTAVGVLVAALGVYFGTRRRFPLFARAFGWTFLGTATVLLGALALWMVFMFLVFRL